MDTIGLIAAIPSESNALLRKAKIYKRITIGSFRGASFQFANRNCILVTSGIGSRRADEAARLLIWRYHPSCLISFGIAGAVREDLQIGDVIMATQNCVLGKVSLTNYHRLTPLADLTQKEVERAVGSRAGHLYSGTAVTTMGTQPVLNSHELMNPVLEMETSGILHACEPSGTPLVVLRSISDGPSAPLPFDLGAVMDENSNLRLAGLLLEILKHPGVLFQSVQILKNSRLAADNAAIAVMAAIGQPFRVFA